VSLRRLGSGRCAAAADRPRRGGAGAAAGPDHRRRPYRRPAAALAALQGQLRAVDGARALGGRRARRGAVGRRPDRGRRRRLLAADRPAAGPAGKPHAQPARRNPVPAGGLSMGKLKGLLKSGWFITLVGLLLLAAIIWFFGPYLGIAGRQPLAGPVARLGLILAIVLAWAI